MRVIMLILAVIATGCGMSNLQVMKSATDAADGIGKITIPRWNKDCEAKADKCVKDGVAKAADCKALKECQKNRGALVKSLAGVHSAVAVGSPLALQGKDAGSWLSKALQALENARLIAMKSGFLGGAK